MSDDRLTRDVSSLLHSIADVEPSNSLRDRIAWIPERYATEGRGRRFRFRLQTLQTRTAAIGLAAGLVAILVGSLAFGPNVLHQPARQPSPEPTLNLAPVKIDARYPDGIPSRIDGQPVYVGLAALVRSLQATDTTPFLVGGWLRDGSANCWTAGPFVGGPTFGGSCGAYIGGTSPSSTWSLSADGPILWNDQQLPGGFGPAVARVHTHDPRAAVCVGDYRARCESVLVVERVLWAGDEETAAGPVSIATAVDRIGNLQIIGNRPRPDGATQVFRRNVFAVERPEACPAPWPSHVFDLHGDPRFAMLAVFPSEQARSAAQSAIEANAASCPADARVVRPGSAHWVEVANVLALVYGDAPVADAARRALDGGSETTLPFPDQSLDESYSAVDDYLSARADGTRGALGLDTGGGPSIQGNILAGNTVIDRQLGDMERRLAANALSFTIGTGRPATEGNVGAWAWQLLQTNGVPGTASVFDVDHPESTDPALAHEVLVAYRIQKPEMNTWAVLVVSAARWPDPMAPATR